VVGRGRSAGQAILPRVEVQASVEPGELPTARKSLERFVDGGPRPKVGEVDGSPNPAGIRVGAVDYLRGEIQGGASRISHVSEIYIIFRTI
jgi:hypothetical protein